MESLTTINQADLVAETKKANEVSLQVSSLAVIKSPKELETVKELLSQIKKGQNYIAERERIAYAAVKSTRDMLRPLRDKLDAMEASLKSSILSYKRMVDKKVEEQKEKIAEKVESGKVTFDKGSERMEKVEQKKEAFKTRKIKEVIIEKPEIVPKKYWAINQVMVRTEALAGIDIPGVKVIEKEITIT